MDRPNRDYRLVYQQGMEGVMREIKFRAWDIRKKTWHYYEIPIDMFRTVFCADKETIRPSGLDYENWCQYTGLRDKNGKEIYEGDVVVTIGDYGQKQNREVLYGDGYWIPLVRVEYGYNAIDRYDASEFEVIGNIYENPELLESK